MTLVTSFDAFDARVRRIVVHSWSGKLSVGRNASAARRPRVGRSASAAMCRRSVGRSASAAMRRRSVGRNAADYVPTLSKRFRGFLIIDVCYSKDFVDNVSQHQNIKPFN